MAWNTLRDAYHGRTRTHLLYLFSAVSTHFDDRKSSLTDHIAAFEAAWLLLATSTACTDSMAAAIKNFHIDRLLESGYVTSAPT